MMLVCSHTCRPAGAWLKDLPPCYKHTAPLGLKTSPPHSLASPFSRFPVFPLSRLLPCSLLSVAKCDYVVFCDRFAQSLVITGFPPISSHLTRSNCSILRHFYPSDHHHFIYLLYPLKTRLSKGFSPKFQSIKPAIISYETLAQFMLMIWNGTTNLRCPVRLKTAPTSGRKCRGGAGGNLAYRAWEKCLVGAVSNCAVSTYYDDYSRLNLRCPMRLKTTPTGERMSDCLNYKDLSVQLRKSYLFEKSQSRDVIF